MSECPVTGKTIVSKTAPFWCKDEGYIYPWHLEKAGSDCPLISDVESLKLQRKDV